MTPSASIVISGVSGWLSGARAAENANGPADAVARQNMLQLIHLRWIAVAGQVVTILAVHFGFGFKLPLAAMMLTLGALVALNLFSLLRLKRAEPLGPYDLFAALALDAVALTVQLYFSGGATNPFTTLYLLHVILGAVLLEAWATWAIGAPSKTSTTSSSTGFGATLSKIATARPALVRTSCTRPAMPTFTTPGSATMRTREPPMALTASAVL